MVSKNQIKLITSLQQKKFRETQGLFIAEGKKVIDELLCSNYELFHLYESEYLFESVPANLKDLISITDLRKISALTTANNCLAIFRIPEQIQIVDKGLIIALDDIRDPGNLGTIIRLCDWFGIEQLVCSTSTVNLFNPKVIQATMGSISRVNVQYLNLCDFINSTTLPIYGTFMNGKNIYKELLPKEAVIVLGNEANGISEALEEIIKNRLTIPRFGELQQTESLNVASASAILMSEFCRIQA